MIPERELRESIRWRAAQTASTSRTGLEHGPNGVVGQQGRVSAGLLDLVVDVVLGVLYTRCRGRDGGETGCIDAGFGGRAFPPTAACNDPLLGLVAVLAACGPTATDYCERLYEGQTDYKQRCPEAVGEVIDEEACPNRIARACSGRDLELLMQDLDCKALEVECGEYDALIACGKELDEPSQACALAQEDLPR